MSETMNNIDNDDLVISDFNAADYFEDEVMVKEYINRAVSTGDDEVVSHALQQVAKYREMTEQKNR